MSGLLASLALRSRGGSGGTAAMRPRLPSRFEPAPPAGAPGGLASGFAGQPASSGGASDGDRLPLQGPVPADGADRGRRRGAAPPDDAAFRPGSAPGGVAGHGPMSSRAPAPRATAGHEAGTAGAAGGAGAAWPAGGAEGAGPAEAAGWAGGAGAAGRAGAAGDAGAAGGEGAASLAFTAAALGPSFGPSARRGWRDASAQAGGGSAAAAEPAAHRAAAVLGDSAWPAAAATPRLAEPSGAAAARRNGARSKTAPASPSSPPLAASAERMPPAGLDLPDGPDRLAAATGQPTATGLPWRPAGPPLPPGSDPAAASRELLARREAPDFAAVSRVAAERHPRPGAAPPAATAPGPAIQVTIGRIEVRAESSSGAGAGAAGASRRRPAPPVTLGEYLHERGRGGAR